MCWGVVKVRRDVGKGVRGGGVRKCWGICGKVWWGGIRKCVGMWDRLGEIWGSVGKVRKSVLGCGER